MLWLRCHGNGNLRTVDTWGEMIFLKGGAAVGTRCGGADSWLMLPAKQNVFDLFQPSPSVVPLKGRVSLDKIRPAPDETPPATPFSYCTLLLYFPWLAAKSPSSGLRGKTKQILFPSPCFQSSLKFPWHQQIRQGRGGGGGACLRTFVGNPRPPFCRVVHLSQSLKGLVSCFPTDGFTLHLHTEITHSICENHLLEQTCLLVLKQLEPCNYALATHASSVYQTRVWLPEILRFLTHRIRVMSSSRPSLTLLSIWCSSGFHAACPDASFDIQSWNSRMMPTITWGRFTG